VKPGADSDPSTPISIHRTGGGGGCWGVCGSLAMRERSVDVDSLRRERMISSCWRLQYVRSGGGHRAFGVLISGRVANVSFDNIEV
jgi:hypothetical protein